MSLDALMAQVVALRAQVEAMASTIEFMRDHEPLPRPVGCSHSDVENVGTFGAPAYRCRTCGADMTQAVTT